MIEFHARLLAVSLDESSAQMAYDEFMDDPSRDKAKKATDDDAKKQYESEYKGMQNSKGGVDGNNAVIECDFAWADAEDPPVVPVRDGEAGAWGIIRKTGTPGLANTKLGIVNCAAGGPMRPICWELGICHGLNGPRSTPSPRRAQRRRSKTNSWMTRPETRPRRPPTLSTRPPRSRTVTPANDQRFIDSLHS
jgi:hypothetical protein